MSITLIAVPLCLAIGLILVRIFEIRQERMTFVSKNLRKLDDMSSRLFDFVDSLIVSSSDVAQVAQQSFVQKMWVGISHAVSAIKHVTDKTHDKIHGKKEIKEKGNASFFFQSVSDHKKQIQDDKGRPGREE